MSPTATSSPERVAVRDLPVKFRRPRFFCRSFDIRITPTGIILLLSTHGNASNKLVCTADGSAPLNTGTLVPSIRSWSRPRAFVATRLYRVPDLGVYVRSAVAKLPFVGLADVGRARCTYPGARYAKAV